MKQASTQSDTAIPQATARCMSAFFDELSLCGVCETVISPGSRSTPLSIAAFEMSRRWPHRMKCYVCIDERSAAFFALGIAKAARRPVALVCTSGTALANYYPAVLEAEAAQVPVLVLSGDRPPRLQGLSAPQTCDQLKAYGTHVRHFIQMPLCEDAPRAVAFVRQCAREAVLHAGAGGVNPAGPVHLNFPFEEPLTPDFSIPDAFVCGRSALVGGNFPFPFPAHRCLGEFACKKFIAFIRDNKTLVLAGEGSATTYAEACEIRSWAHYFSLPIVADPLSGLRCFDDEFMIDNADSIFRKGDYPHPELVIRLGPWPVSKACWQSFLKERPLQLIVDPTTTRDFNTATDMFVSCTPLEFVHSIMRVAGEQETPHVSGGVQETPCASEGVQETPCASEAQRDFAQAWIRANDAAGERICAVEQTDGEGAYVRALFREAPARSCVFSANSMAIRAIDTFYAKVDKPLSVLCNRGLNGIDGTLSAAIGAACHFKTLTFLTGDLTLQHDIGGLALQRELHEAAHMYGEDIPTVVVVLFNNNGGGIFEMLPQRSDDPYFKRLFSAPQDINFAQAATAFSVPYQLVCTPCEFVQTYRACLKKPGISLIEIQLPLAGLRDRYAPYQ